MDPIMPLGMTKIPLIISNLKRGKKKERHNSQAHSLISHRTKLNKEKSISLQNESIRVSEKPKTDRIILQNPSR